MAVLALNSTEYGQTLGPLQDNRQYWPAEGGKFRLSWFTVPALAAQADITSTIELCNIPPGKVRVLPSASKLKCSAWGAGATLDVGVRAYVQSDGKTAVAELGTDIIATKDLSAALNNSDIGTVMKKEYFSAKGIRIFATVRGANAPANATLEGYIAYEMQQ